MLRVIIFVILCYLLYRLLKKLVTSAPPTRAASPSHRHTTITDEMVRDPFCQVYIPKRDAFTAQIAGETVYFCSKECKEKYLEEKFQQRLQR